MTYDVQREERMKRILVVDDSTTILKFVEGILEEHYKVVPVKSGELALAYLKENRVDMVFSTPNSTQEYPRLVS